MRIVLIFIALLSFVAIFMRNWAMGKLGEDDFYYRDKDGNVRWSGDQNSCDDGDNNRKKNRLK